RARVRAGEHLGDSLGVGRPRLAGPIANHDDSYRIDKDEQVEQKRVVLDIVKIVFKLLDCMFYGRAIRVAYLRPPCYARFDAMPDRVERYLLREHRHELGSLGPRTDKAHFAAQHVDQLW